MSDDRDGFVTADELVAHGFDLRRVQSLPVPTYHTSEGEPYWLREDLAQWLDGWKGGVNDDRRG